MSYISRGNSLSKKITINEELLNNQKFITKVTQYNCNIFPLIKEIYGNNIEIMTNVAIREKGAFKQLNSVMRRKIIKNKEIALKIIEADIDSYIYLNKEMQVEEDIVIKVLTCKPAIYENFINELKNDEIKTLNYIKRFDIDVKFLADSVKGNKEIAFIIIEKNGKNFEEFPLFKDDQSLVELAFTLVNDYGNHKNDYEIVKECILKHNNLYGRFKEFKEDYEILHIFIEGMKKATKGVYTLNLIPNRIKAEASMNKAPVYKYVFHKTMEKKSLNWNNDSNVKEKKLKL